MKLLSKIFISQSTDFHFAKYRFHFAKYRFSFRKAQISFRFISQSTVSHENNIRGSFSLSLLSNCSSFILTALSSSVWQDSIWSDMSAFSGETTTTNGFDGNLVPRVLSLPRESTLVAAGHVLMYTNQIHTGGGL